MCIFCEDSCIPTLFSHNNLQQLKSGLIFTQVIWHVAICINSQQVSPTNSTHRQKYNSNTHLREKKNQVGRLARDAPWCTVTRENSHSYKVLSESSSICIDNVQHFLFQTTMSCGKKKKKSKTHAWMRSCTRPVWPQVAAACRGVHSSLSQALTQAPASSRHCTTSTKSSMQHWQTVWKRVHTFRHKHA